MSPPSIFAVTADRAVAAAMSSAGRTISTTSPCGSRPCAHEAAGRPVVLFAHSYGGLICTDYVLSGRPAPDLLVLSAPALGDGLPRWQHIVAPLIARIWPTLAFKNAWGPDVLSRDPEVGRLVRLDPGSSRADDDTVGRVRVRGAGPRSGNAIDAGRADARVPRLGRSPRATHGDRALRGKSRASPGACTQGFGTRRSTNRRARRSSPTSSRGCARRSTGARPSRSLARRSTLAPLDLFDHRTWRRCERCENASMGSSARTESVLAIEVVS